MGPMGSKVPVPEVSAGWDPIDRWTETSRWKWHKEEHNNVLEGRAGTTSAKILSQDPKCWNRRGLLISDSQVVISIFSKGRNSKRVLNRLARRIAAICLGCNMKLYWRYMRTWRNHADGPSRGYPIGVAPKISKEEEQDSSALKHLPEIFYATK